MTPRPALHPFVRVFRRGPGELQIGTSPDAGLVISGLDSVEISLTRLFDGRHDLDDLRRRIHRRGGSAARLDQLIATLQQHRLLSFIDGGGRARLPGAGSAADEDAAATPAALARLLPPGHRPSAAIEGAAASAAYDQPECGPAVLAARATRHVLIDGLGPVVNYLAPLLRTGGVGRVDAGPAAVSYWDHRVDREPRNRPDLVVLLADGAVPISMSEPWRRRGVAHLPVVSLGPRLTVGPLVTPTGPCLRCVELHRCQHDEQWPSVLAALSQPGLDPEPGLHCDSVAATLAAGWAAMLIHLFLDGAGPPTGLAVEVAFGRLRTMPRRWTRHPGCPSCRSPVTMGP